MKSRNIWENFTNQKQWEAYLKNLIRTNEKALKKAIVIVYNNQTLDEKSQSKSFDNNHIGFSKVDAYEMSLIANKIINKRDLTPAELAKSSNKMTKYWKQLMVESKKKIKLKEKQETHIEKVRDSWEEFINNKKEVKKEREFKFISGVQLSIFDCFDFTNSEYLDNKVGFKGAKHV